MKRRLSNLSTSTKRTVRFWIGVIINLVGIYIYVRNMDILRSQFSDASVSVAPIAVVGVVLGVIIIGVGGYLYTKSTYEEHVVWKQRRNSLKEEQTRAEGSQDKGPMPPPGD